MKRLFKNSVIVILLFGTAIYLPSCKKETTLPVVITTIVSDITQTTALAGGTVTDDGGDLIAFRGICWSTSPNPTTSSFKTINGSASSSFTSSITGLTADTKYYLRAFATNSAGTGYGNEVTFTTNDIFKASTVPTLTTSPVTAITTKSAVSGGTITSDGGGIITKSGLCWGTTPDPVINGINTNSTNDGSGNGSFESDLYNLAPNTTYYVRAYAVNSAGNAYGDQVSFITNPAAIATLTTTAVSSITSITAVSGGNITTDGGAQVTIRGVCWGTSPDPTINDNGTNDGSGPGNFTSNLTVLNPGTIYFLRSYAINAVGVGYGNEVTFTTPLTYPLIQKANFPGVARSNAVSFSVGTKVYIGLGFNDADFPVRDFWEWDQETDTWTKKADFPGNGRSQAVGFSIGTKGYIGTGQIFGTYNVTNEFWEYDPVKNTWTMKSSLPATAARAYAVGFSIGNKGYIGAGNGGNDFWEWDQETDTWTRKADFPANARIEAIGFSIGNKGYIGTGESIDDNDYFTVYKDFWEWDQATNVWIKRTDFPGIARSEAVGFSIGNKGYIGTGMSGFDIDKDFWEWDQATDSWTKKTDVPGVGRYGAVGVSTRDKGYIGIGIGDGFNNSFWEFDPTL